MNFKRTVLRQFTTGSIVSTLLVILAVFTFRSAVADWNDVPTGSMIPTIQIGDRIVVDKLAYDLKIPFTRSRIATWDDPARGDIVICWSPADGTRLVKRVVAVPGDTIAMRNNRLMINGRTMGYDPGTGGANGQIYLTEDLTGVRHAIALTPGVRSPSTFGPVVIPSGKYFMMGDNRDQSADSRYFGLVDRSAVAGRVKGVALSLDYENGYRPRWSRFFDRLI